MIVYVNDNNLNPLGMIEDYFSLVWAERFQEAGDFEMELPPSYLGNNLIELGNFLTISESDKTMMVEMVSPIRTEEGRSIIVKGRSAEAIFDYRVLSQDTYVDSQVTIEMMQFVRAYVTAPSGSWATKKIHIFHDHFPTANWSDPIYVNSFDRGTTVYEVLKTLAAANDMGFRVNKVDKEFWFWPSIGTDRTVSDNIYVTPVTFSEELGNIISGEYHVSSSDSGNVVYVESDDDVYPYVTVVPWGVPEPSSIDRKEIFRRVSIDRYMRGISYPPLQDHQVLSLIFSKGYEFIEAYKRPGLFEGDLDLNGPFKYRKDFWLGDIVNCFFAELEFTGRLLEVVRTYSGSGNTSIGTFDFNLIATYPT